MIFVSHTWAKSLHVHLAMATLEMETCVRGFHVYKLYGRQLRDQLVCGLKDPRIQRELLCVQKLTVAQALERARAMEAVAKEAKHLQFEGGNTEAL